MRLTDLTEDVMTGMSSTITDLKSKLLQPGIIEISDTGFSTSSISLGHLEQVGAGKIIRQHPRYEGKWFGFLYGTQLDGQPIRADLKVGNRILKPGQKFIEEI